MLAHALLAVLDDSRANLSRMCGRVVTSSPRAIVEAIFQLTFIDDAYAQHFNIRPTDPIAILREPRRLNDLREIVPRGYPRGLEMARWDLIPSTWSGKLSDKPLMINARVESIRLRPSFRDLVDTRRCAVIVDGFYEWKREGKTKTPHYVHRADGEPQAFAGLWDEWTDPSTGEVILSATILTGDPAGVMIGLARSNAARRAARSPGKMAGSRDLRKRRARADHFRKKCRRMDHARGRAARERVRERRTAAHRAIHRRTRSSLLISILKHGHLLRSPFRCVRIHRSHVLRRRARH